MLNRLNALLFTVVSLFIVSACDSGSTLTGNREIEQDLRVESIEINLGDFSPAFDPNSVGPYEITVDTDVSEVQVTVGAFYDDDIKATAYRQVALSTDNLIGREESQTVVPNQAMTFSLEKGLNVIHVRTQTDDGGQYLRYLVRIHRISDEAELDGFVFDSFRGSGGDEDDYVQYVDPEEFDPEVTDYELTAPYRMCTVGIRPVRSHRYSTVTVNGEEVSLTEYTYIDLSVGNTPIEVVVTSEDGSESKTFNLTMERREGDQEALDENYTLQSLDFAGADLSSGADSQFHCLIANYQVRVNNDQPTLDVSAVATVSERVVELARVTEDDEGNTVYVDIQTIPADGAVTLDIEVGSEDNQYVIALNRDDDDELEPHYYFTVTRSETNWVRVETAEAFQAALQSAQANQEIVLDAALYEGAAGAELSGMDGVVFYSNASGTEEQPIVIRSSVGSVLQPVDEGEHTVLQLSGDYWEVTNIALEGGARGIVLDAASHNTFDTVVVTEQSERGVELRNGSHSNAFARLVINNIGPVAEGSVDLGEGLVVGSPASTWSSAPEAGPYEALNSNNRFSNIVIGPSIYAELVDIKEGAENTLLANMVLDSRDLNDSAEALAAMVIRGNETEISYTTQQNESPGVMLHAMYVADAETDWLTEAWGENTEIFDNQFDFNGSDAVNAVMAEATVDSVFVDENTRIDGGEVVYSGAAIDESFTSPVYQLQLASDSSLCLARESVDLLDENDNLLANFELMLANACADVAEQKWRFVNDGEGEVLIRSIEGDAAKAAPRSGGNVNGSTVGFFVDSDSDIDESSFLRWIVNAVGNGEVVLTNRYNSAYAMTMVDLDDLSSTVNYDTEKEGAAVLINLRAESQRFKLVPLAE